MGKKKLDEYCVAFDVLGLSMHVVVRAETPEQAQAEGDKEAERRGWDTRLLDFRGAEKVCP